MNERRKGDRRIPPAVAQHLVEDRGELLARIEDLESQLEDTESRRANAARNSSAFEDRMCDLQVENDKLRARIAELEAQVVRLGRPYVEMRAQLEQEWCQLRSMQDELKTQPSAGAIHIVFDGPPGPECGRFVEAEDASGRGINAGEWSQRADGYWQLVIKQPSAG